MTFWRNFSVPRDLHKEVDVGKESKIAQNDFASVRGKGGKAKEKLSRVIECELQLIEKASLFRPAGQRSSGS